MNVCNGKILKGIGGFYYVKTENGVIECKACGKFRKKAFIPYVGDDVELNEESDGTGYITQIYKRKNVFIRPPVANIDKLVIVVSVSNPEPDFLFVDKLALTAEANNVEVIICFNKSDLVSSDLVEQYSKIYSAAGYKTFVTSSKCKIGIDAVAAEIKGCAAAFSGFSGVGKSSLVNEITGVKRFDVGEISKKLNRGKHTTRHVEFVEYDTGSYIVDTPGFSMLELSDKINKDNIGNYFREFYPYTPDCKFADCHHESAKYCGVCQGVSDGEISQIRYNSYLTIYEALKNKKEWEK